jgi:hypothetical protein
MIDQQIWPLLFFLLLIQMEILMKICVEWLEHYLSVIIIFSCLICGPCMMDMKSMQTH